MLLIIGLVIAGILLIGFEIVVPGGILGVLGAVLMLGAVGVAFSDYGFLGAAITLLGSVFATLVVVIIEFQVLAHTKFGQKLALSSTSGGRIRYGSRDDAPDADADESLIGQQGETVTTMAPSGRIVIDGKAYEAYSQSGFLERGERVEVVARDAFRVVVQKAET